MCDIIKDRIRINKILEHTVSLRLDTKPTNLDELTRLCVVALQIYYDGACPDECVADKARNFAVWHLAHLSQSDQPPRRATRLYFDGGRHDPA